MDTGGLAVLRARRWLRPATRCRSSCPSSRRPRGRRCPSRRPNRASRRTMPWRAAPEPKAEDTDVAQMPADQIDVIGPFTVLSVGNRLGEAKLMQAAKIPQLRENLLGIRVSARVPGEKEKADILWQRLQAVNFRQIGIQRHGK